MNATDDGRKAFATAEGAQSGIEGVNSDELNVRADSLFQRRKGERRTRRQDFRILRNGAFPRDGA
jgi:hypothetical protein